MMDSVFFLVILSLTFPVFFVPKRYKYFYSLLILLCAVALTSVWSFRVSGRGTQEIELPLIFTAGQNTISLIIDPLSAFFIIVINITVLTGFLYAGGYLKPYYQNKNSIRFSLHFISYLWLYLSMILVVVLNDGLPFLIAWEIMALSSFLLVIFDAENRSVLKTGISYLIQMHIGMFFILTAFLVVDKATGQMSFNALKTYFAGHADIFLFVLFFIGFGIKAGFIPLHTWLPEAHPAAPSHISGVMSGVMIKMGIYGILRVLMSVQDNLLTIGIIIILISLVSGILGVMMAIVQKDLKRLLAYSSIENVGIIGLGIGLGMIGLATRNETLSLLGFSGGLLHVLNHSLFKSLLFYNAGSVYKVTHTRNIEQMGGLIKKMPYTSVLFLTGSLAICGLPPFNGFISEYLFYIAMFKGLPGAGLYQSIIILASIVGLSLIGGLAIFCFTKAFGIVFLGQPRSEKASLATEVEKGMIFPQYVLIAFILMIGLASVYFVMPVFEIVAGSFGLTGIYSPAGSSIANLTGISIISGLFILIVTGLLVYRFFHLKNRQVSSGPTWGCGYIAASPKQQYTATSYAYNYNHIAKPLLRTKKVMAEIREDELFPTRRTFESHSYDIFKKIIIDKPVDLVAGSLKKIAVMQTGLIQHYILYAFIYLLIVFLLTYFHLI